VWEVPYGPEWEWLRRETRDFEDAVRRGPSFPVYEVWEPRLGGGALAAGAGGAGTCGRSG